MWPWFESGGTTSNKRVDPVRLFLSISCPHDHTQLDPQLHNVLDWIDRTRPNRLAVIMDPNTEKHRFRWCPPSAAPHGFPAVRGRRRHQAIEHAHALWSASKKRAMTGTAPSSGWGRHRDRSLRLRGQHPAAGVDFWLIPTPCSPWSMPRRAAQTASPRWGEEPHRDVCPPLRCQLVSGVPRHPAAAPAPLGHGRTCEAPPAGPSIE